MVEPLIQLAFEGDPSPLRSIIKSVDMPKRLFDISNLMIMDLEDWAKQDLYELSNEILPEDHLKLFKAIYSIYKCDPEDDLKELTEILGIDPKLAFILSILIGCMKSNHNDARRFLKVNIVRMVNYLEDQTNRISNEGLNKVLNYFLSLSNMFRQSSFDIFKFVVDNWLDINPEHAKTFYEACRGHLDKFDIILDKIGYKGDKNIIIEFCNLLFKRDTDLKSIAERLNVDQEDTEVAHALIHFCISTSSYHLNDMSKNTLLEIDTKRRLTTLYLKQAISLSNSTKLQIYKKKEQVDKD